MPPTTLSPSFVQIDAPLDPAAAHELALGLLAEHASIAPKFFYDALGSRLFDAITELPEYYPTRTEKSILDSHCAAMARWLGTGHTLIDLGAGNGEKAERLFPALEPRRYVAVDISVDYLRDAVASLKRRHPALPITGLGLDFSRSLELPPVIGSGSRLFFYPGSSIGNFDPPEAEAFLRRCRSADEGGGLLIGVDLVKDEATLNLAYDDPLQVTAAFNRNVLRRVNALLGADAQLEDWQHVAFFDATHSRVEMHVQARRNVRLSWPGASRSFAQGERIHTENSYKYTLDGFADLLKRAGYGQQQAWTDERGWFAVFAARA